MSSHVHSFLLLDAPWDHGQDGKGKLGRAPENSGGSLWAEWRAEEHDKIHALLRFFFPFWGSVIKGRTASWGLGAREGFQESPCHLHGVRNWSHVVPSFSF